MSILPLMPKSMLHEINKTIRQLMWNSTVAGVNAEITCVTSNKTRTSWALDNSDKKSAVGGSWNLQANASI